MDDSNDSSEHNSQDNGANYKPTSNEIASNPHRDYKYEQYYKDRKEGPGQLQPQVQSLGKHWYDEYPIADRRKLIEESMRKKKILEQQEEQLRIVNRQKPREFESFKENFEYSDGNKSDESDKRQGIEPYPSSLYKKYEPKNQNGYEKRYSQYEPQFINADFRKSQQELIPQSYEQDYHKRSPRVNKFSNQREPILDNQDFEDLVDTKNQSKSYNRNMGIHKRAFVNKKESNLDSRDLNNFCSYENERQIGRSASHGFERQFKNTRQQPVYNAYNDTDEYRQCELKFNKKSINYDMTEIELPAYCKNHSDGKLLYIITPEGQESELGCAHCAMEVNKKNLRCSVVEVKDKLDDYIENAGRLLGSNSSHNPTQADPSLVNKINSYRDKEIAIITQYYERVMDALKQERDNHIQEIASIAEQNTQMYSHSYGVGGGKRPKVDIKLNNFCVELGKVVEGVDETGIHIKELWKINQDYKDVVAQKFKDLQNPSHSKTSSMMSFEFQPAHEDILKDLAKRIGKVVTQSVPSDYYASSAGDYSHYKSDLSRFYKETTYDNKIENVPTFGAGVGEERRYSDRKYQQKSGYQGKTVKSISPVRPTNLGYSQPVASFDPKYDDYDRYNGDRYNAKYSDEPKPQRSSDYKPIAAYDRNYQAPKYDK